MRTEVLKLPIVQQGEVMNTQLTNFGDNVSKYRKLRGLTQEQLAAKLSVTPQAVSKWENGSYPDGSLLAEIANVLDVSLDVLFGRIESDKIDFSRAIMHDIRSYPESERTKRVIELGYYILSSFHENLAEDDIRFPAHMNQESFAQLRTDSAFAIERLNPDTQYLFFQAISPEGADTYIEFGERVCDLFKLLSEEGALRMIRLCETLPRNFLITVEYLSNKLKLPKEIVSDYLTRFDHFGITWQLNVDLGEGPVTAYGYVHNVPVLAILTLATSVTHFISHRELEIDTWKCGPFRYGSEEEKRAAEAQNE